MLQQCPKWRTLNAKEAKKVRDALPAISAYASLHGMTPDTLLNDLLGDLGCASPAVEGPEAQRPKKKKKSLAEHPVSHQRAVWLNHEGVTEFQQQKERKADEAKAQAKATKEAERQAREQAREQAGKEKKEKKEERERAREAEDEARRQRKEAKKEEKRKREQEPTKPCKKAARAQAMPQKTYRCANPLCGSICEDGGEGADDWLGCGRETCGYWFCPLKSCKTSVRGCS